MKQLRVVLCVFAVLAVAACSGDNGTQPQIADGISSLADASGYSLDGGNVDMEGGVDTLGEREYEGEEGPFEVRMAGKAADLIFRFNGKVHAREAVSITLRIAPKGGQAVPGKVTVDFGNDRRPISYPIHRKTDIEYTFREEGSYRVFAVFEDENGGTARGGFRIRVRERRVIDLQVEGIDELQPGEPGALRFVAMDLSTPANRNVGGELFVDAGNGTEFLIKNFDGAAARKVVYPAKDGEYTLKLTLTTGGKTVNRSFSFTVEENTGPSPNGDDAIDLSQVIIAPNSDQGVAGWRVTSTVTGVSISRSEICIFHTRAGQWPITSDAPVEGNPWVVANLGGQLHGGTYEWVRPGQECKGITAGNIGQHVKEGPLGGWTPRQGERIWLFMSTQSRLGYQTSNERSNVVEAVWPY